jgi:hypothetical protein
MRWSAGVSEVGLGKAISSEMDNEKVAASLPGKRIGGVPCGERWTQAAQQLPFSCKLKNKKQAAVRLKNAKPFSVETAAAFQSCRESSSPWFPLSSPSPYGYPFETFLSGL